MPSIGDLLYAFALWLKTTPLVEFSLWASKTWLSQLFDKTFLVTPVAQSIHILAIAIAFGSVVMINLRLYELSGQTRTIAQTAERYLPWIKWALVVLLVTGLVIIVGDPVRVLLNPAFWTKMILVVCAILVNLWFQRSVARGDVLWELAGQTRLKVRIGAGAVLLLWCAIIFLGRWIAYVPV